MAKINPDLVVRDKEGKPYSVRYEAVNAMLLNEFLKEHRKERGTRSDDRGAKAGMPSAASIKAQTASCKY